VREICPFQDSYIMVMYLSLDTIGSSHHVPWELMTLRTPILPNIGTWPNYKIGYCKWHKRMTLNFLWIISIMTIPSNTFAFNRYVYDWKHRHFMPLRICHID